MNARNKTQTDPTKTLVHILDERMMDFAFVFSGAPGSHDNANDTIGTLVRDIADLEVDDLLDADAKEMDDHTAMNYATVLAFKAATVMQELQANGVDGDAARACVTAVQALLKLAKAELDAGIAEPRW